MKTRFAIILVVLNAAALAAGYVYFNRASAQRAEAAGEAARAEVAALKEQIAQAQEADPVVVYRTNAFNWNQLESADYKEYIANLRSIGCPESTIRDIILTDVMRLYALRRGKYYHNGRDFKFWETNEKRHLKEAQLEEREKALAAIDKELPAVLRELLGINYEREVNKYFVDAEEEDNRLAFLSEDKRTQALALREKFEGEREKAQWANAGADALKKIDAEQEAAFGELLTGDEKEQYELSMSPVADKLRALLVGFNPSEAEFKSVFQLEKAVEERYGYEDANDPTAEANKATAEQGAMEAFKGTLPADRQTQLNLSSDPEYQNLCTLSEQFDLPPDTSGTLLDMRKTAEDERQQLLNDKSISADRLAEALKAIQDETEKQARQALGDQAYQQYSQSATWIKSLGNN